MPSSQQYVEAERAPARLERVAFPIAEFCARNDLSLAKYHSLKREGRGPAEMRDGFWVRITAEAERDWQRAMTNPQTPKQIAVRTASEAKTKARGKKAGDLSAASPRHVSKQRKR